MAWIKTIAPRDADKDLREMLIKMRSGFPPEYGTPAKGASGSDESIVESHTLIPGAMYHAFMTMSSLMADELPLERRHHEMIATVVSEANDCHY